MTKFRGVAFLNAKFHFVTPSLRKYVVADMESRGCPLNLYRCKSVEKVWIELPGMVMADEPTVSVPLAGTILETKARDFEYILQLLEELPLRMFGDGTQYFKLHGRYVCVVMTPSQRLRLVVAMRKQLEEATKLGLAATQELNRRLEPAYASGKLVRQGVVRM